METLLRLFSGIKSDNQSGSVALLNRTIAALKDFLEKENMEIDHHERKILSIELNDLLSSHSQLVVFRHFISRFNNELEMINKSVDFQIRMQKFIHQYKTKWDNINQLIARNAFENIDFDNKNILTHSNSSTICSLFKLLKQQNTHLSVVQAESRPEFEGRLQARHIADLGYPVTLIIDAAITRCIKKVDMVIVGADSIFSHNFMNKVGTHAIALACEKFKVPLYVLADSRKIIDESNLSEWKKEVKKPAKEIWSNIPPNITPENYYFEFTPNELISFFITEHTMLDYSALQGMKEQLH